jgi:hypothetical protein
MYHSKTSKVKRLKRLFMSLLLTVEPTSEKKSARSVTHFKASDINCQSEAMEIRMSSEGRLS